MSVLKSFRRRHFPTPPDLGHKLGMDDSDLLHFTPVALRSRRDGWTAARQRAFIALLSEGLRPGPAAARVGMSRQTAYSLRGRPGAASFASAWDAAVAMAGRRRAALRKPTDWERGVEGLPHAIRYRGRVVAIDRRCDMTAFRRVLARADRFLEKHDGQEGGFSSPWAAEPLSAFASRTGKEQPPAPLGK